VDLGICSFQPPYFAVRELIGWLVIYMFSCLHIVTHMFLADIQNALDYAEF
jgi:hypothetical protein